MRKLSASDILKKQLAGERIENYAADDPKLAAETAAYFKNEERRKKGILITSSKKIEMDKVVTSYFGMSDLAKQFLDIQPLFYDSYKIWWAWDLEQFRWKVVDETDVLILVKTLCLANTVKTKTKLEILEAIRQESRTRKPKPIKTTWIQFNHEVFDIATGDRFKATPEYFVTNPIPYSLHSESFEETPKMDEIFAEWVGEDHVKTLYEIIAYCLLPDYPIHRLFCFIGAGMNGKSCFLNLLRKFVGKENCCSTELDTLLVSRFEVTRLHKKLVCQLGETNFNEMSKTSMLKKLSGGDLIGLEYKNKNPFEEVNYAKILISTNNLPTTSDKTIGFYRRWMIIDFPNQFSEAKDILGDIPEEEYEALALKCTGILNDLLKKRAFHNEGTIEERMEKYESKSNFLGRFLELHTDKNEGSFITKNDFYRKFKAWCKENRHRELAERSVGLSMKKESIEGGKEYIDWHENGHLTKKQVRCWEGIRWKE